MPISRLSPAKRQQMVVVCDSADIAAGDVSGVLAALKSLSSDRSSAMSAEGVLTLVFNGYDADPRELEAIPEVRKWFAKLNAAWPYWSFFASRIDTMTVPLIFSLLLSTEVVASEPGIVRMDFDSQELKQLLRDLFIHQNELIERLEIGKEVNQRVTADFVEAINAFLG